MSLAGLDLLQVLSNHIEDAAIAQEEDSAFTEETRDLFWKSNWLPVVEGMASASKRSPNPVSQGGVQMMLGEVLQDRSRAVQPHFAFFNRCCDSIDRSTTCVVYVDRLIS